jgi:hypothetical protein
MAGLRSGLGADRALGLLARLGAGMAEDVLITGGSNRFGVSGAEAQAELDRLKGDAEFVAKAMKAGTPERTRWERLNRQAAEYQAGKAGSQIGRWGTDIDAPSVLWPESGLIIVSPCPSTGLSRGKRSAPQRGQVSRRCARAARSTASSHTSFLQEGRNR